MGDRFGGVALQVRSHLTRQIHDTVQSLYIDLVWRLQGRLLSQSRIVPLGAGEWQPQAGAAGVVAEAVHAGPRCKQALTKVGKKGAASEAGAMIAGF